MLRQLSQSCAIVLCLLVLLVAYGHAGELDELRAAAKQAEQGGQFDAAAELYHRAEAIRPEDFTIEYRVALLSIQLENWPEAEEHLGKALALRPTSGLAHLNLGVVYFEKGQREEARGAFVAALRFAPSPHQGLLQPRRARAR